MLLRQPRLNPADIVIEFAAAAAGASLHPAMHAERISTETKALAAGDFLRSVEIRICMPANLPNLVSAINALRLSSITKDSHGANHCRNCISVELSNASSHRQNAAIG